MVIFANMVVERGVWIFYKPSKKEWNLCTMSLAIFMRVRRTNFFWPWVFLHGYWLSNGNHFAWWLQMNFVRCTQVSLHSVIGFRYCPTNVTRIWFVHYFATGRKRLLVWLPWARFLDRYWTLTCLVFFPNIFWLREFIVVNASHLKWYCLWKLDN